MKENQVVQQLTEEGMAEMIRREHLKIYSDELWRRTAAQMMATVTMNGSSIGSTRTAEEKAEIAAKHADAIVAEYAKRFWRKPEEGGSE